MSNMNARFPGRCACGARFAAGTLIDYDRNARKVVKCPACANGAPAAAPTDLGQPETPAARPADALPTPTLVEAKAAFEALFARLDVNQRAVAEWTPGVGNTRVVAAAGSGKTTTTVALVARLLWMHYGQAGGLPASSIVATTFTRKAAGELQERLARVCPPGSVDPSGSNSDALRVGTFHSLALQSARRRGLSGFVSGRNLDGSPRNAGIPSTGILWARILDYAGPEGLPNGGEGLGLADADVRAYMLAADVARSVGSRASMIEQEIEKLAKSRRLPYLPSAFRTFVECKAALSAWDFADALASWHDMLGTPGSDSAKLVIVDEAQDNSRIQIEIAQRLARASGSVIFVGDLRQSIYGWRGAAPRLFAESDRTISAATMEIPTNYRSTRSVVALGNAVAQGKEWSLGSDATAHRTDEGTITVAGHDDPGHEAKSVAADISNALASGARADDHAILVRTNAAAANFEAALLAARIPVAVTGGTSFFGRRDVLDALAYVSLAHGDDRDALSRIYNRPKRYLGKATMAQVPADGDVVEALRRTADRVRSRQSGGLRDLADEIASLREVARGVEKSSDGTPVVWPAVVAKVANLLAPNEAGEGAADEDRGGLLPALVEISKGFDSAASLLAFAARCRGEVVAVGAAEDAPTGRVIVSTIHKAKGLEWPTVYVSAPAGVFPHSKALEDPERRDEEERLFYVAVTRAKDTLHLTYSEVDLYGRPAGPSTFLAYVDQGSPEPTGGGPAPEASEPRPPEPAITTEVPTLTPPPVIIPPYNPEPAPTDSKVNHEAPFAPRVTPAGLSAGAARFGDALWKAALAHAEIATLATPKSDDGSRFVEVKKADFDSLLGMLGFTSSNEKGQVVYTATDMLKAGAVALKVWSTIPPEGDAVRSVGEDSIKVSLVFTGTDGRDRPMLKKLPYATRTRGWRVAVLDRIEAALSAIGPRLCSKCGAPTVVRTVKARCGIQATQTTTFHGCARYPDCK